MHFKKVIGVVAVVGVIVGGFLGGLFPKFGAGPGLGTGRPGVTTPSGENTGDPPAPPGSEPAAPSAKPPHVTPEQMAPLIPRDAHVLNVCIDGDDYLLGEWRQDKLQFVPSDAEAIVAAAKKTTGNSRGVRVRVDRTDTAKAGAEVFLEQELTDAGIDKDAIQWLNGPRP